MVEAEDESTDGSQEEFDTFISVGQNEMEQPILQNDLRIYHLSKDKERREVRPPNRYSYANLVFCALLARYEVTVSE